MNTRQFSVLLARISLFTIYFWFGLLKVIGQSPASEMIHRLFDQTLTLMMPSVSFGTFIIFFGFFEMLIGILFILPGLEKSALILLFIHILTTAMPIFVLPKEIWANFFVPTLEGQYIIKNIALVTCVLTIWESVSPTKEKANPIII